MPMSDNITHTDLSALNPEQKEAVLTPHKRVLVIAGAGSGKTKTLLQKLTYLINDKKVKASNILAITFTKNAANEMIDRLIVSADSSNEYEKIIFNDKINKATKDQYRFSFVQKYDWINHLTVKTFHSFCYGELRTNGVHEFDNQFKVIGNTKTTQEQFAHLSAPETEREVMKKVLIALCDNREFMVELKRYVLDYLVDRIHIKTSEYHANYPGKRFRTLKGDWVKSKSERFIADWLYRHSIAYKYEPEINQKDFSFKPDFYIPQANLFLEHVSRLSYPTGNKEKQFKQAGRICVQTHDAMAKDSALFQRALDRIVKGKISDNYTPDLALSFEDEFKGYHADIDDFVSLLLRVNNMIKVENLTYKEIYTRSKNDQHERIRNFYRLACSVLQKYTEYCTNKSYLDFNDMIIKVVAMLEKQPEIREKLQKRYRYILVDEFQDVNNLQVKLINLLLNKTSQLFCVGDDWQSIYGFRGSEVNYIINFEKHFHPAKVIKLNLNYRSTQNIVGASNEVIKHNKFKVDKDIRASKKSKSRINIYAANDEEDGLDYFIETVNHLLKRGYAADDIMVLYRRSKMYYPFAQRLKAEGLKIPGKTIHAAKGLESRAVFIIGLKDGYGGFPDIWLDDRIFQVIKKARHDLLLEEERRLFYVAITRAKDELFLITTKGNESSFINEIPEKYALNYQQNLKPVIEKLLLCPACSRQVDSSFVYCPFCAERLSARE